MKKLPLRLFLKNRREELKLSQQEVAEFVGITKSAISRWESGDIKNMGIDKLKKLSEILRIDPITIINYDCGDYAYSNTNCSDFVSEYSSKYNARKLTDEEKDILEPYNLLNRNGKRKVVSYAYDLIDNDKYLETVNYIGKAAAGNGYNYLDEIEVETTIIKKERPVYDFIIKVTGDSMEPKILDGSLAFVRVSTDYDNGKIYVVDDDGTVYIKKVYFENDKITLKSINDSYDDIIIDSSSGFRVLGEVVDWEQN